MEIKIMKAYVWFVVMISFIILFATKISIHDTAIKELRIGSEVNGVAKYP